MFLSKWVMAVSEPAVNLPGCKKSAQIVRIPVNNKIDSCFHFIYMLLSFGWGIPFVTVILLSQLQTCQRGGLEDRKSEQGNTGIVVGNGVVREILESSQ